MPEKTLWVPARIVSTGYGFGGEISDMVWLLTEWEIFGTQDLSMAADETVENQARLEYYTSDATLLKYKKDNLNSTVWIWLASPM